MASGMSPKIHINTRILQSMVSGIPPYLGPWNQNVASSCSCGLWGSYPKNTEYMDPLGMQVMRFVGFGSFASPVPRHEFGEGLSGSEQDLAGRREPRQLPLMPGQEHIVDMYTGIQMCRCTRRSRCICMSMHMHRMCTCICICLCICICACICICVYVSLSVCRSRFPCILPITAVHPGLRLRLGTAADGQQRQGPVQA